MSLENRYNNVFGSKTSAGHLNSGFFTLFGGVLLGLAALTLFLIALFAFGKSEPNYYNFNRVAFPLGAVGLSLLFLGITTALPTRAGLRILAYVGTLLCFVAAVLVAVHYPENFNVGKTTDQSDYIALDVGVFALGLAMLLASVVTSIIGYYLGRLQPAKEDADEDDDGFSSSYEVPDWVVEKDIEYAMKKFGVELLGSSDEKALKVNVNDSLGGNVKVGGMGKARVVQLDAEQVDVGVAALGKTNPKRGGSLPSEWADDAVNQLRNFRRQKAADPEQYQPKVGFWARLWAKLTGRSTTSVDRAAGPIALAGGAQRPANRVSMSSPAPSPGPRRGKTIVIEDEK